MCGIAAVVDFDGPVEEGLLTRMCEIMQHRGPDARGLRVEGDVGLGMQRLAIIDVDGGDQPISNEDDSVSVVLNGEIYNFPELRERLALSGHRFTTRSDTEVLVHLYEDHGTAMVEHLRGMFAFALWDRRRRRLLCARDRVGKKPLFYARSGRRLLVASEIRAILQDPRVPRDVDPDAIDAYLALQYVPHPLSAFRAVRKLPPASTLEFGEDGLVVDRYWRLTFDGSLEEAPDEELEARLREQLREATRLRLISDVPVGAFLSGGLDSSAVVAMMAAEMTQPVRTFSIGFAEPRFDESRHARAVAERFGTQHEELRVEPRALTLMPSLARHYGEPFADPSAIPSFLLAEFTRRHVTVALNGDGGDEAFAGYGRYRRSLMLERADQLPSGVRRAGGRLLGGIRPGRTERSIRSRAGRLGRLMEADAAARYSHGMSAWNLERRRRLLLPDFAAAIDGDWPERLIHDTWERSNAPTAVERMLDVDIETYLPGDLLVKVDIASMAYSLEARSPFLDHELLGFAASLPVRHKLSGGKGKRLLRQAMRGILPDAVLDRPKMGFGVPLAEWFRGELRDLPADRLLDAAFLGRGYVRRDEVERTITEHRAGRADHSLRLWVLLQLEAWHAEVVDAPVLAAGRRP